MPSAFAQEEKKPHFSVGGLLFGDSYYVVSNHMTEDEGAAGLNSA